MIIIVYNNYDCTFGIIYIDIELKYLIDNITDELDIKLKYTNADDPITKDEQNNHIIREIFRSVYYRLPYNNTTRVITR